MAIMGSLPGLRTYLLNLFLLHSWIPLPSVNFSLNGPSWILATELFLYASFPFLIHHWRRTRWLKLALCAGLGLGAVALGAALHAPLRPWGEPGLYAQGFVYFLPPARIVEFGLGMLSASLWLERRQLAQRFGPLAWSMAELLALGLTVLALMVMPRLPAMLSVPGGMLWLWLSQIGCAPVFAILIAVLAFDRGLVAKALSPRPIVLLGEISFALYLVHSPIAQILFACRGFTQAGPMVLQMALYWAVSLLAAWGCGA
jgi:peptidoglycan/LPS O-acetylase OafA/YrhL